MVEASSPQSHMERLAPLLVIVSQLSLTSAYCRPASRHSDRHLHDCPLDALRCILFEACTVCLSLWLIIEPREGLSEPPQVYLWRQHQSNWGCCYTRLHHVAPGVENYRVALPSLRETARVAAVFSRGLGIAQALCDIYVNLRQYTARCARRACKLHPSQIAASCYGIDGLGCRANAKQCYTLILL